MPLFLHRAMPHRLRPPLLLFASLAIALLVAEALVRVWFPPPAPRPLPEVRYEPHDVRRFDLKPDQVGFTHGAPMSVDDAGFRRNGEVEPAGEQPLIVALGDSFTFGMGVRDEETWPAVLERGLGGDGGRVLNAGRISYDAFQELDLLEERLLALKPAVVVHQLYWNDYMNASPPDPDDPPPLTEAGYFVWDDPERFQERSALRGLASRSALVQLVRAVLAGEELDPDGYEAAYRRVIVEEEVADVTWSVLETFYDSLIALSAEHDFELKVVHMPVVDALRRDRPASHPFAVRVRDILERRGIPYLDGFELWEDQGLGAEMYLPYNRHLNAEGYRIVGERLTERVVERRWLPGEESSE